MVFIHNIQVLDGYNKARRGREKNEHNDYVVIQCALCLPTHTHTHIFLSHSSLPHSSLPCLVFAVCVFSPIFFALNLSKYLCFFFFKLISWSFRLFRRTTFDVAAAAARLAGFQFWGVKSRIA